jgi:hypothetical protein
MPKTQVIIKLRYGCLNCDEPIPLHIAIKGKIICCRKCLRELNKSAKKGFGFTLEEVWKHG